MRMYRIPVKDLRKAKIRYYEEGMGCEIPEIEAYALLIKIGDEYRNVARPLEECNVYDRVPYSNRTQGGDDFGTKIVLASGEEKDGVCYIIEKKLGAFEGKDYVTVKEIDDEIINNLDVFYFDRWDLCFEGEVPINANSRIVKKADRERRKKFIEFLESKEKQKTFEK